MNRKLFVGVGIILLISTGVFFVIRMGNTEKASSDVQTNVTSLFDDLNRGCRILDDNKAKTLLGAQAVKSDDKRGATASSSDMAVSQCLYLDSDQPNTAPQAVKSINLLVRTPRSETGRQDNRSVFDAANLPQGAEEVSGYGDKAFWNPAFSQLNILDGDSWFILEFGSIVPENRNLADTLRAADVVLQN